MSYKMKVFWDRLSGMTVKHLTREILSWQMGENLRKTLLICSKWSKRLNLCLAME